MPTTQARTAKPRPKPPAAARQPSAAAPAAPVAAKAAKPAKPAKPPEAQKAPKVDKAAAAEKSQKAEKAPRKPKPVLVRDGFTMPEADFALIAQLKQRAMASGREAKKSELLRAGLQALAALDGAALVGALNRLEAIKIGRPKKGH